MLIAKKRLQELQTQFESYFNIAQGKLGRKDRTILYFLTVGGLTFITYIPLFIYLRNWPLATGLTVGALACWSGMYTISMKKPDLAAKIAVTGSFLAICWNSFWLGGVFSIADLFVIPTFIVSWLIFGPKTGFKLAACSLLATSALFISHIFYGSFFTLPFPVGSTAHAALFVGFKLSLILVIFGLIFVFHYFMQQALDIAERLNAVMSAILSSDMATGTAIFDLEFKLIVGSTSSYFERNFQSRDLLSILTECEIENQQLVIDILKSVMNEDILTWEINLGNLPLKGRINGRRHHLEWRPVYIKNVVNQIIFSAHNVEDLLQAQSEASVKTNEAMLLLKLVSIGSAKTCDFLERAKLQIQDAKQWIAVKEHRPAFIALHTVKGAARTLGFGELSEAIHHLESEIQSIDPDDFEIVTGHLQFIENGAHSLGYSQDFLVVSRKEANEAIEGNFEAEYLLNVTQPTLEGLVLSFAPDLAKLAKNLNKIEPLFEVVPANSKTFLTLDAKNALTQCFIHIFRNSMDHGIESPNERKSKQKPEIPKISIHIGYDEKSVQIVIFDDGRGLDLPKIKEKALSKGLRAETNSQQQTAELIFLPGFSTADSVSQHSGRGVGMDAIREAMELIGGKVEIAILSNSNVTPWQLILSLPRCHVLRVWKPEMTAIAERNRC